MSYYLLNREERLSYQKEYNKSDTYKSYQQEYYQKNKEQLKAKHKKRYTKEKSYKPLPKYKLDLLERMCKQKLKDYNNTVLHEKKAIEITKNKEVFNGFCFRNSDFTLVFD